MAFTETISPLSAMRASGISHAINLCVVCILSGLLSSFITYSLCNYPLPLLMSTSSVGDPTIEELSAALEQPSPSLPATTQKAATTAEHHSTCWPSPNPEIQSIGKGLLVQGAGCHTCRVGEFCSFAITVESPTFWNVSGLRPFQWDIMVTLQGPSRVHAHVELTRTPTPITGTQVANGITESSRQTFIATYRAWDSGTYRASISNPCFTLTLPGVTPPPYANTAHMAEAAAWTLTVEEETKKPESEQLPDVLVNPCTETLKARWVQTGPGNFEWVPFSCAVEGKIRDWFLGLAARGVKEVAFIGDSHLRLLLLHSVYLLTGKTHYDLLKAHHGFEIFVPALGAQADAPHNATQGGFTGWLGQIAKQLFPKQEGRMKAWGTRTTAIRFTFTWVDGIFKNGEHGCKDRGLFSKNTNKFPDIPGSPDIVVTDSGAWTAFLCQQPSLAYAQHLNSYITHIKGQVEKRNNNTDYIFFGNLPNPTCRGTAPMATNSLLAFQADFARVLVAHHGFHFFNTWEVVAPMFHKPCLREMGRYDPHFSCFGSRMNSENRTEQTMQGDVGEAMAQAIFRFIFEL